jgi:Transposase DDE domain
MDRQLRPSAVASGTMDGFSRDVAKRLPLAEAVWRLFDYVCGESFLNDVFQRHRGRSYEDLISFSTMVRLIGDALLEHGGSGRQSLLRAKERGELPSSARAVYAKLGRMPIPLSMGLLTEASARLASLFPISRERACVPASLKQLHVLIHDGKTVKHVEKRLKVLRNRHGKFLGGKLVVTKSLTTGMVIAMGACEDGESGEVLLVPEVLQQCRRAALGIRLHVADRQYCDLTQTQRFTETGDHFVVRWHAKTKFFLDEAWASLTGVDRNGRQYTEDWGWLGRPSDKRRRRVRRICLKRGEEEDLILVTDLDDPGEHPASDLLDVYLERWSIERVFQQVSEVFHLGRLIGTTPKATVFQSALCFLLYNMIQVIRAYVSEGHDVHAESISTESLFGDVRRQLVTWTEMLKPKKTVELMSTRWTSSQVGRRLRQLLRKQWSDRWIKSPSNTHKTHRSSRAAYPRGGHNSIHRLLAPAR